MRPKKIKRVLDAKSRQQGFTLIEVMTVLVIIALLAVIAYPSYEEAVRKSKRTEGRAALMQLLQQQERYYSQHNSYIRFPSSSVDQNDTIQNCVQLIAMPGTAKVDANFKDSVCGDLIVTSTGVKDAKSADCWK
jgi:type IV pilus assembly protein PilE